MEDRLLIFRSSSSDIPDRAKRCLSPTTTPLASLPSWANGWYFTDCDPVEWVVCGGVALLLQGLNQRTTRDVDVLGNWDEAILEVTVPDHLPEEVRACVQKVADAHPELEGLGSTWVNLGPSQIARFGLPRGYAERLTKRCFGPKLTVHLLDRKDLVALKLYAAADDLGPRQHVHEQDLRRLGASVAELDAAIEWLRTIPDFELKRIEIRNVLERLGHDDLAYYV
jgi:hypothetical protein